MSDRKKPDVSLGAPSNPVDDSQTQDAHDSQGFDGESSEYQGSGGQVPRGQGSGGQGSGGQGSGGQGSGGEGSGGEVSGGQVPASGSKSGGTTADAEPVYSIGALAKELDTTARTIRFYEAKGLISPQRNGVSRVYSKRDRGRLIIIMRGRRLGFSLEEIGEYLSLYDAAPDRRLQVRHLNMKVTATMTDLKRKLTDIQATLSELEDIQRRCQEALAKPDDEDLGQDKAHGKP